MLQYPKRSCGYRGAQLPAVAVVMTKWICYLPIQTGLDPRNNKTWPDNIRVNSGNAEPAVVRIGPHNLHSIIQPNHLENDYADIPTITFLLSK